MTIMFTSSTFIYIIAVLPIAIVTFFAMAIIWTWRVATFCIYGYAFVNIYNKNFSDNCNSHGETYRNLPNFLVWKFCGKAQFAHSFGRFTWNYTETVPFPQNFHTRKSRENKVLFPVSVLVYYENKTLAKTPHYSNVLRYSVEFQSHRNQSIDL